MNDVPPAEATPDAWEMECDRLAAVARDFIRDFLSYAGGRRVAAVLTLMLAAAVFEGISLAFLVPLLGLLQGGGSALETLPLLGGIAQALSGFSTHLRDFILVAALVVALGARSALGMVRDRRATALQVEYTEARRVRLIRAVAEADWSRIAGLRHGQVTTGLTIDISRMASAAFLVMQIAVALVMLGAQLAVAILLVPAIGIATGVLILAGGGIAAGRLRAAARHGSHYGKQTHTLVDTAAQLLGGLKAAVAEQRQDRFVADFTTATAAIIAQSNDYVRRNTRFHFLLSVAISSLGGAMLLIGLWMQVDLPLLIAALVTLVRMTGPVTGLYRNGESLAQLLPSYRSVTRLESQLAGDRTPPCSSIVTLAGEIALADVTFSHGSGGVHGVTLRIAPGEVVGIVGTSGAGKTTLVDLIAGLLPPQFGTISVGGHRLDAATLPGWRTRIAYAGQEAHLINTSIRANLAGPGIDEAMMWSALEQAAVADTVRAMPDGLDTVVAERGMRLSGGERQRIAIARTLLRRPALLILDEATNAVDIDTERRLLEALHALDPRPTMLIVAHRPETLRICSRVIRMEAGRIVDDHAA